MHAVDSFGAHTASSARALADAGVRCALRYHYSATRDEVRVLHDHGISFCLIAEFDTVSWHPPLDSPETGAEHARKAVDRAHALGIPAGAKITLTVDTMVYPGDFERVRHYFDLAYPILHDAGYLVDAYGGSLLIDYLHDRGLADTTWEAAARSWSSATGRSRDYIPSRTALMRQLVQQPVYGGVQCDLNVFLRDPVGEWMPDGSIGGDVIPSVNPEDLMGLPVFIVDDTHPAHGLWRVVDGRWRRRIDTLPAAANLVKIGELDSVEKVDLTGPDADWFAGEFPEEPGPQLVTCAADTTWSREVAGLGTGETARFFLQPNAYLVRVHDDGQWNADRFVGVPDKGVIPEQFLYNQPLLPWSIRPADVTAVVAAINEALDDVAVDADLTDDEVDAIARRVVQRFAGTVHFATEPAA